MNWDLSLASIKFLFFVFHQDSSAWKKHEWEKLAQMIKTGFLNIRPIKTIPIIKKDT
jgi:hypothetical protein